MSDFGSSLFALPNLLAAPAGTSQPADMGVAWQRMNEANGRLVQGMISASQHQMGLMQQLMGDHYADLAELREAGTNALLPAQQIALAKRRYHRSVEAMRTISDEMFDCFFDTAASGLSGWAGAAATEADGKQTATPAPRSTPSKGA
jgi:hypothetical protein